jgi:hypothetical protein
MRTSLPIACVFSAVSFALPSAGCKTAQDRVREEADLQVLAAIEAGSAKLSTPPGGDGGGGGGLAMGPTKPEDFPKDIPIYPGSVVRLGGRSTGAGRPSWSLTVTTGDSRERAAARYKEILIGFEKVTDLNMGDAVLSIWRNPAYDMTLMIGTAADSKTTITLNVASK